MEGGGDGSGGTGEGGQTALALDRPERCFGALRHSRVFIGWQDVQGRPERAQEHLMHLALGPLHEQQRGCSRLKRGGSLRALIIIIIIIIIITIIIIISSSSSSIITIIIITCSSTI